jgi:hypothetical protein
MTDTKHRAAPVPKGLGPGGRALWRAIARDHELDGMQLAQLTEACRMKDRCDKLDTLLRGEVEDWAVLLPADDSGTEYRLQVAGALSKANETANSMKQLLAALRLPDTDTGKRPQRRGPRGAQKPSQPGGTPAGNVSSMERARQRAKQQTG